MKPSQHFLTHTLLPALVIGAITALYFATAPLVPFHPDESTYLFTSQDAHAWLAGRPADLFYAPQDSQTSRSYYRLVDPPFAKLVIGFGLAAADAQAPAADWHWDQDWQSNLDTGGFPSPAALQAGRWAVMLWFPLTLVCIYWIGVKFGGPPAGTLAVLLFGLNALALLHTRRAMSEGILLFFSALTLALLLHKPRWLFFTAAAAALALNAKVTGAASAGLTLLAAFIPETRVPIFRRFLRLTATAAILLIVTLLLNPVHWNRPLQSLPAAFNARSALMQDQRSSLTAANPEKVLSTLLMRTASLAGNQFYQPPALSDISNYDAELAGAFDRYLSKPIHHFTQGDLIGTVRLLTATMGLILLLRSLLRSPSIPHLILFAGWLLTLLAALFGSPLPYQRYALPLVLYEAVFSATALVWLARPLSTKKKPERFAAPAE